MQTIETRYSKQEILPNFDLLTLNENPIRLSSPDFSAIMISETSWREIQETLYLLSIDGMRDSLISGINTQIEECSSNLAW